MCGRGLHRVRGHRQAQAPSAKWPRPPGRSSAGCRTGRWSPPPRSASPCGRRRRSARPCRSCRRRCRTPCSRWRRTPLVRSTSAGSPPRGDLGGSPLRRAHAGAVREHRVSDDAGRRSADVGSARGQHQVGDDRAVVAALGPPTTSTAATRDPRVDQHVVDGQPGKPRAQRAPRSRPAPGPPRGAASV